MKRLILVVACLVYALAVAAPANSTTLTLDYLIGTVVPATPANTSAELGYTNTLINWYNGDIGNPDGGGYDYTLNAGTAVPPPDLALATGGVSITAVNNVLPGPVDLTGYTYVFAKFGQDGALYYLNGFTSLDGFDPAWGPFTQQGGGLSGITLFGPGTTQVPEAGALIMFASGLIGLVGYRRMRRMQ
ncbi:MAG: hypothetical protein WAV26_03935 [Candidatus Deferrimicrobium sp.]